MIVSLYFQIARKYLFIFYCLLSHYYLSFVAFFSEASRKVIYYNDLFVKNKNIILTGGTSGIGLEVAKILSQHNINLIIASNDKKVGQRVNDILRNCKANVQYIFLDLNDPLAIVDFVNDVVKQWIKLDVLINNAGIIDLHKNINILSSLHTSVDLNFSVNFLGPSLLTYLLLPLLRKQRIYDNRPYSSRIVNVSSVLHQIGIWDIANLDGNKYYNGHGSYATSKLAVTAWTLELGKRLKKGGIEFIKDPKARDVTANCCHPGVVFTGLYDDFSTITILIVKFMNFWGLLRTPSQAAQTILYLALSQEVENVSGKYFENCAISKPSVLSQRKETRQDVWELSLKFAKPYKEKINYSNI